MEMIQNPFEESILNRLEMSITESYLQKFIDAELILRSEKISFNVTIMFFIAKIAFY